MILKAELLIEDCEMAINRHTKELQGEDFRISWFTIVCLLRAIGHVLEKVDKHKSPQLKSVIESKWRELNKTKPSPQIFWEFIEFERNRFLKEYEHGIRRGVIWKSLSPQKEKVNFFIDTTQLVKIKIESPSGTYRTNIASGVFKGRNEKEVAIEALNWWKSYVEDIKNKATVYQLGQEKE